MGAASGYKSKGLVTNYVKRLLREKYANRCCRCGWSQVHALTGVAPLVAHHIDGHWANSVENNLELLCPKCHALTSNYCGLNKGNGRRREQKNITRFVAARKAITPRKTDELHKRI